MLDGKEPRLSDNIEVRYSDYLISRGLLHLWPSSDPYVEYCDRKRRYYRKFKQRILVRFRHYFSGSRACSEAGLTLAQRSFLADRLPWKTYNSYRSTQLYRERRK